MPAPALPTSVESLLRALLPRAEQEEIIADLREEYAVRHAALGGRAARRWLWRQVVSSSSPLLRLSWWRGWTGFEPRANRMRPGGTMLESSIMDLRYAARRLLRRPTYALLSILTLALGAGGTAAIFGVARGLLFEPLPIARESEVGVFWNPHDWSEEEFLHLRPDFPGFRTVAAYRPNDLTLQQPETPLRVVRAVAGTGELFEVLGTAPVLGRTFAAGDDAQGAEPVVVLSYGLWQELGGDPSIIGRRLQLGTFERTVVGVMPRGFWFPDPSVRLWTAAALNPENRSGMYALIGRVAQGSSIDGAQPSLARIAAALGERFEYPEQWDKTRSPGITPVREYLVGSVRPGLVATLGAMAVILLIACANVAALMLGQVDARSSELAVRSALGAGRHRIIRQLVIEALLVGAAAGVTGALIGALGFRIIVDSLPLGALAETAALDWALLWSALGVALLASVAIAAVPAFALLRGDLRGAITSARTSGIGGRGGRLEGGLVVGQVALAVLLAAGAGLMLRSVANLRMIDPGVTTTGIAVIDVSLATEPTGERRRQRIAELLALTQAQPRVQTAAVVSRLPLRSGGDNWGIAIEGQPERASSTTSFRVVSRDYFDVMGMRIVSGRSFEASDRMESEPVVVINEALARAYFPGEDPVGRRISGSGREWERIVGVVNDISETRLTDDKAPARYVPYDQMSYTPFAQVLVLRLAREEDAAAVLDATRRAIQRDVPAAAVERTTTMSAVFTEAVGPVRQVATLLLLLTLLALVLGAIGVYGVISHFVTRRQREYGIRIALGLPPARVVRQVVGRGGMLVAIGSACGVAGAVVLARLIASLLYGVDASDPLTMAAAVAVLLAVGTAAAFVPAHRASRTDPALVLREQ